MTASSHQIVRDFFVALSKGTLSDNQFTSDMTFWSLTGGAGTKDKFLGGVKFLQSLFPRGLTYTIESIVAEGDKAVAEVRSHGILADGQEFDNVHVFTFRIQSGKISAVKEYQNPDPVRTKLGPLLQAAMAKAGG